MSTLFPRLAIVSLLLGCGRSAQPANPVTPSPPEERVWKQITVSGPYGTFDVAVPVVSISTAQNGEGSLVVDSVALRELEKTLTARIAHIVRAQAASMLIDTAESNFIPRNPAPAIKPGLIGVIPFEMDGRTLTQEGVKRLEAASALLHELPGMIQIVSESHGTGHTQFDAANTRARHVYEGLLTAEPRLGAREIILTVRTHAVLAGAPVPVPAVEVYYSRP